MSDYQLIEKPPELADFIRFREIVGWGNADLKTTQISIQNTLYWVQVIKEDEMIACGRIIGDGGGIYYYIQDVIVHPDHRGKSLGDKMMQAIMIYIRKNAAKGAFIGLMAAKGVDDFYLKYGFKKRPSSQYGSGMCLSIR